MRLDHLLSREKRERRRFRTSRSERTQKSRKETEGKEAFGRKKASKRSRAGERPAESRRKSVRESEWKLLKLLKWFLYRFEVSRAGRPGNFRRTLKTAQEESENKAMERELPSGLRSLRRAGWEYGKIKRIRAQGGCHGTDCRRRTR